MPALPDVTQLSHAEKDTFILALWQRLEEAERRIAELEAKLAEPPKTPNNSSLPPSKGEKPNQAEKRKRNGPRQGSLGRKGGGRPLARNPDATVVAKALSCVHCRTALTDADQVLHDLYDKIDLPPDIFVCGISGAIERVTCRLYPSLGFAHMILRKLLLAERDGIVGGGLRLTKTHCLINSRGSNADRNNCFSE